ncbi:ferredoxin family protein [Streptomyces sp. NPDC088910]|uniref:4Fe-4S dicluster domain-containing protein n=1 Tax=Streptomyces sp. NPDC088910 TaxID=3365911 RepID=UPI00382113F9
MSWPTSDRTRVRRRARHGAHRRKRPADRAGDGARAPYIHPDERVDSGAWEPVCPAEAVYYEDGPPDDRRGHLAADRDSAA